MMKIILVSVLLIVLVSCSKTDDEVSFELGSYLKSIDVTCDFLKNEKYSKSYWVRSELDGNGLLVITKNNNANFYDLSLSAHGHERALETRKIQCEKL